MVRMRHDDELIENHDINLTPLIDVLLVLLIIFMVVAPMTTMRIKVDLPASEAQSTIDTVKPVYLTITADKTLLVGDAPVTRKSFISELQRQTGDNPNQALFLQADKTTDYNTLMQVLDQLQQAGYRKVGLVTIEPAGADR